MYFENIEESSRFILIINIFYSRVYFYVGLLRLDFFCLDELKISQLSKVKRKLSEVIQKSPRGPGALRHFFFQVQSSPYTYFLSDGRFPDQTRSAPSVDDWMCYDILAPS